MRARALRRAFAIVAIATLSATTSAVVSACGYHVAIGGVSVVHPSSIPVAVAIHAAVGDGRLAPLADAPAPLALVRAIGAMRNFAMALQSDNPGLPPVALVLVEAHLWGRVVPGAGDQFVAGACRRTGRRRRDRRHRRACARRAARRTPALGRRDRLRPGRRRRPRPGAGRRRGHPRPAVFLNVRPAAPFQHHHLESTLKNLRPLRQFLASAGVVLAATAPLAFAPVDALAQSAPPGPPRPERQAAVEVHARRARTPRATLPFGDTRDFDEQKKGLIAPMKELKIRPTPAMSPGTWSASSSSTAGRVRQRSTRRCTASRTLNKNYGLYEVIPGIYQVRGFDLADVYVRPRQDRLDRRSIPLTAAETARAALEAVPGARRRGPAGHRRDLLALPRRPLGRRARRRRRGRRARRQGRRSSRRATSWQHTISENVYAGNAMNRRLFYQYGVLLPVSPYGYVSQGLGQDIPAGSDRADRADPDRREGHRGVRGRRRADGLPEHAEHRGAVGR